MQLPKIELNHLTQIFYSRMFDALKGLGAEKNKQASDKVVLNDISIQFNSGESIGIIGKNGAGKSTLLSIIAGILKPTQGHVMTTGKVTTVMTLGLGLREDLSGRDNIYIDGEIQGKTRDEIDKVVDQIIAFSELGDFIDKPVKFYSTGMKSRLAFSMLVCIEPEILIIDEALSAGDIFFAEKASKKIREICQLGKIVIIVSHSMESIKSLCNRCLWLESGSIVMDETPEAVTQAYLQKVREEDASAELTQLQKETSLCLPDAQYVIKEVVLKLHGANYAQKVFYTGDLFVIEMVITQPTIRHPEPTRHPERSEGSPMIVQNYISEILRCAQDDVSAHLEITIERLDGLIVDTQTIQLSKLPSGDKAMDFKVSLSLDALSLNKGFYQLNIDLCESQRLTNQLTRFFEVKNVHMAQGGVSVLHYPSEILLINEKESVCFN